MLFSQLMNVLKSIPCFPPPSLPLFYTNISSVSSRKANVCSGIITQGVMNMSEGIFDKRWEQKFILPEHREALLHRKIETKKLKSLFLMNTNSRKWRVYF